MSSKRLRSSICLAMAAITALFAAGAATARRHDPEKIPDIRVRDLHYGDVLFYFYQSDDFEAITRLLAYQHWKRIPHHEDDGQLLLGGLYLSLGMHNEAGDRFQTLLTRDVPTGVRNRAWFYLAQVWYTRGYLEKAEEALGRIQGKLSPDLEAQKEHLYANVLMHEGKFDQAIQLLSGSMTSPLWSAYARFNLGVALVRSQRLPEADGFLTTVGTMYVESNELLALKDRANLALGFAYLQANQPEKARQALERVRLNGPYSNKALLGTGWADAALGDYQRALSPWLELRGRNLLDSAVQESYLAVPYAFNKLNASAQAAEYYETALKSYDTENGRLDEAIGRIQSGQMLDEVLTSERDSRYGWFWQLKELPNAPESRYLYGVLAGHDFQEGLKNYRDLLYMGQTLTRWGQSMDAFEDMIDTREHAYAERLPRVDSLLASGVIEKLAQRRGDLEGRINAIESSKDVAAVGSPEEREQWARLQRIEAALAVAPDTAENAELRERLRIVKGVLYFRLDESFKARMWQEHRTLKDLDLALREAQNRWIRVDRARKSVPSNNGEFAERVAALRLRIDALQGRLVSTEQRQSAYLAQVAVGELEQQKNRLAAYQVQARFALAELYDRAANADHTPPAGAAGPQPGPQAPEQPVPRQTPQQAPQPLPPAQSPPPQQEPRK